MKASPQTPLIQQLARRIREIEQKEHRVTRPDSSTPFKDALEEILPEEVRGGSLVELLSAVQGAGAWTLALLLAKQACGERKALVIADSQNSFYPPAACKLGIDLSRTIVVHAACGLARRAKPQAAKSVLSTEYSVLSTAVKANRSEPSTEYSVLSTRYSALRSSLFAAIAQSLRCPAVGAVMGWFDNLPSLDFRRLQLAAEAGGGLGLLLRPASALPAPSFAAARLLVTPVASGKEDVRRMHIEAVRMRGRTGQTVIVEVNDETGHVHLPARLAAAKTMARAARSSG